MINLRFFLNTHVDKNSDSHVPFHCPKNPDPYHVAKSWIRISCFTFIMSGSAVLQAWIRIRTMFHVDFLQYNIHIFYIFGGRYFQQQKLLHFFGQTNPTYNTITNLSSQAMVRSSSLQRHVVWTGCTTATTLNTTTNSGIGTTARVLWCGGRGSCCPPPPQLLRPFPPIWLSQQQQQPKNAPCVVERGEPWGVRQTGGVF